MRFELPGYAEDRAKRRAQIAEWITAAEAGDVKAQVTLGWEYARGEVVGLDIATAWNWFERAAASGQDEAVAHRARFLQLRGVPEGARELRQLALRGNWKAQFWLARYYQSRVGRVSQLRAVVWYDRSAKRGNVAAKLAKLGQLARIAPPKSKVIFAAKGVAELVAIIWQMTWHAQQIELYEPLLYQLKRTNK